MHKMPIKTDERRLVIICTVKAGSVLCALTGLTSKFHFDVFLLKGHRWVKHGSAAQLLSLI